MISNEGNMENMKEISIEELYKVIERNRYGIMEREDEKKLVCNDDDEEELRKGECKDILNWMELALQEGRYDTAYKNAKELKKIGYIYYKYKIEDCIRECADNQVLEANIEMAEHYAFSRLNEIDPIAFKYLKYLADEGYIQSFAYLARCYEYGIGCERDRKKADKYYFESMLFSGSAFSYKKFTERNPYLEYYHGDDFGLNLKRILAYSKDREYARMKIAEMILDGRVKEYVPYTGFVIFRDMINNYYSETVPFYKLGECALYGICMDEDPWLAVFLLEQAEYGFEWVLNHFDEKYWSEGEIEYLYGEDDCQKMYDHTRKLKKEAEKAIDEIYYRMDANEYKEPVSGYTRFCEWQNEKLPFIKRRKEI